MTEWQPIETAPRDGTVVSLKFIWNNQELQAPTLAKWSTDKTRNGGPGAIADGWVGADGNPFVIQYDPTHWMPLPEPPNK